MMRFWIRFTIFTGLWLLIFLSNTDTSRQIMTLLLFATSLCCFFFLSKKEPPLYLFIFLSLLLIMLNIIVEQPMVTSFLLLTVTTVAIGKLRQRGFTILLIIQLVCLFITIGRIEEDFIYWTIGIFAFSYYVIQLQRKSVEKTSQRQLYENLLIEYRQLKRSLISTEEFAKVEERTRIAREIHDSVGHKLTSLLMKIEMLHIETKEERLIDLKQMVEASLNEIRIAVSTLKTKESLGISAIVQLIRKLEVENQLMIEFTIREGVLTVPLPSKSGIVLYRVIQEALTNVMRHSESKLVSIEIGKSAISGISFMVKNPHTINQPIEEGFGIKNMQDRVKELDGRLIIHQLDNHFIVEGMIPIEMEGNKDVANPSG